MDVMCEYGFDEGLCWWVDEGLESNELIRSA